MDMSSFFEGAPDDPTDLAILCPPLTEEAVRSAEERLGHRLPASYLALLRVRNGGYLARSRFPTKQATSWADDHVSFDQVMGVGGPEGIDGDTGSRYLIEEWNYPDVGVVISSDGHTAFLLDYRKCGATGEPGVIWVDMEAGDKPSIVELAPSFESFLAQLEAERADEE